MLSKRILPPVISNAIKAIRKRSSNPISTLKKVSPIAWILLGISPVLLALVIWVPRWQADQVVPNRKTDQDRNEWFEVENKARGTVVSILTLLGGSSVVATFVGFRQLKDSDRKHKLEEEKHKLEEEKYSKEEEKYAEHRFVDMVKLSRSQIP